MGMVKCADCGLLSVRSLKTGELIAPGQGYRLKGEVSFDDTRQVHDERPICFVGAMPLGRKWNERKEQGLEPATTFTDLHDCVRHVDRQVGLTPKEHWALDLATQLISRVEKWQERESRTNRWWRAIELAVMILIVAGLPAVAQIASAFIGRGSLFPVSKPPAVVAPAPTTDMPPTAKTSHDSGDNGR